MNRNSSTSAQNKGKMTPATKELLPLMFEMGRLMKSEMSKDGMPITSYLHIETLRFIEEQKDPSMRDVAEYLKIAPPSATALINTFVKEGVLTRSADSSDRRIVRLMISKKGQRLLQDIKEKREKAFAQVFAPLSAADRKELCRILKIIIRNS